MNITLDADILFDAVSDRATKTLLHHLINAGHSLFAPLTVLGEVMLYHSVSVIWNFFGDVCDLHKHSPKTFLSSIHYTHAPEVTEN